MGLLARKSSEDVRARHLTAGARLHEHNDRVEQNLDPWEVPAWRRHRYAKGPGGKPLFHGSPDQKARQFREWLEGHQAEARAGVAQRGERETAKLVRQQTSAAAVKVPCREPYRFRTRAACRGTKPQAKWTKSSLLRAGRSVEVPCAAERPRVKEFCRPRERRWVPPAEEPAHAFEGLL